jgi:hypothetical protein
MERRMEKIGELLNQPVEVYKDGDKIRLINSINNQELACINGTEVWLNKGGFMTKEEHDNYFLSKITVNPEVFDVVQ